MYEMLEFVGRIPDQNGDRPLYQIPAAKIALVVYVWNAVDEFVGADVHVDGAGFVKVDVYSPDAIPEALIEAAADNVHVHVRSAKEEADRSLREWEATKKAAATQPQPAGG